MQLEVRLVRFTWNSAKKEKNKKVNLGGPAQKEKLKGKDAKIRTYRRN